jgi:hypothetical protein
MQSLSLNAISTDASLCWSHDAANKSSGSCERVSHTQSVQHQIASIKTNDKLVSVYVRFLVIACRLESVLNAHISHIESRAVGRSQTQHGDSIDSRFEHGFLMAYDAAASRANDDRPSRQSRRIQLCEMVEISALYIS